MAVFFTTTWFIRPICVGPTAISHTVVFAECATASTNVVAMIRSSIKIIRTEWHAKKYLFMISLNR